MKSLASLFQSLGWSRDDAKWLWGQVCSVALLLLSGVFDISYWATYIGVTISDIAIHRILIIAVVVLWVSGKMDSSHLPSGTTMTAIAEAKK